MKRTKKITISIIIILIISVAGVLSFKSSNTPKNNTKPIIRLGSSPGPYSELFINGIKPILEKQGYRVVNKSFTNLLNADIALSDNQINLNVDQHTAYLNNFNQEKKAKLVALTKIPTVPTGIYPANKKSLKNVNTGDRVAIPNDPSNAARAYNLLVKAGWITLKAGTEPIKATTKDIATNKYNLKITELDSSTIPRSVKDFEYVILPGSIAYNAKISTRSILLAETVRSEYQLVATTNKENENKQWAHDVKKAYRSKAFQKYLKKHNKDNYWVTSYYK
ncbi:lipoprotein [Leuconostoc litchii]|uniref:Metal ABC transporter substrate-binding protein n=1 Tax=Leuconostoc litchii TaxID=1981069 RepID=A0A6P2CJN9_9LACO|nr:MetQ/NlpA family ABC transporter substrate-binding protein [Leuconostoc litchii]TYC46103.1 metal ABC transporter substrate-binding protein [Leuconostoc litchii]GMA69812.1 lipoprotein [Leuconostoc litchii]